MKKIVYSLIIIMISILVVGCSSSKSLIGEYKLIEMQDGDTIYTKEIRYTLSGDKLILTNDGSKLTFERKN